MSKTIKPAPFEDPARALAIAERNAAFRAAWAQVVQKPNPELVSTCSHSPACKA